MISTEIFPNFPRVFFPSSVKDPPPLTFLASRSFRVQKRVRTNPIPRDAREKRYPPFLNPFGKIKIPVPINPLISVKKVANNPCFYTF